MSLSQIQTFIKNNNHEILDIFIENKIIKYIKIISRKIGLPYFLNVFNYNIPFENNIDISKYNFYFIEKNQNDNDFISNLYEYFINLFPELYSKFLIIHSSHIFFNSNSNYDIKNLSHSNDLTLFLYFDIDMFYENSHIIAHEVEKLYLNLFNKILKHYDYLISNFICNDNLKYIINNLHLKINNINTNYNNSIKLYIKMCEADDNFNKLINESESITSEDTFKDSIEKSQKKKIYMEKLNQLKILFVKIFDKLNEYHYLYWKFQLKLIYFISNLIKYFASINNIYTEINDLLNN